MKLHSVSPWYYYVEIVPGIRLKQYICYRDRTKYQYGSLFEWKIQDLHLILIIFYNFPKK